MDTYLMNIYLTYGYLTYKKIGFQYDSKIEIKFNN